MSSTSSSSSLSGSISNPTEGSGRTFASSFTGRFGSLIPVYNPDGSIKGINDHEGNFYVFNSEATRGSRNLVSGLGASPTLVAANSQAPSTMQSMAGGGSVSKTLSSVGGIPTTRSGSNEQNQMMSGVQESPLVFPMPRSSYPIAGGHSQNQVQGMNSLSSMSFVNEMNSNYTPPIQFGDVPQGFPPLPGYKGTNADYTMEFHRRKEVMVQSQQSSVGYFGGTSTSHYPPQLQHGQAVSSSGISSQSGVPPSNESKHVNGAMGYDQPLQPHQNTSQNRGPKLPPIGRPIRGVGTKPTQATTQSNPGPYGMLGLLSVIKNTKPDLTTLALGMDLTTMGLDMISKKSLFKTFASPWANEPLKDDHDDFTIPQCYNVRQFPLPHKGMYSLELETLFYIFYSMPKDEVQLYAADELYNRGWFYHKVTKCWFVRIGEPLVKTDEYERGTYDRFDPDIFECVRMEDIFIYYEMLEKRPSLPQHRV